MAHQKKKSQVWGGRLSAPPDELNVAFCAGRDVAVLPMADEALLESDIWTNLAHATMLWHVGVLTEQELSDIRNALHELIRVREAGQFELDPSKEDVHINIEHYITHHCGVSAGKKIHAGRSRNDQVATDIRIYLRSAVIEMIESVIGLVQTILDRAQEAAGNMMPGFTHYQPAMVTTAGHWLTGWSQGLLRDVSGLLHNLKMVNRSPLGAAASFGTSWPIDREYAASLLGFDGVEENSLDCISSRGENEARVAASIAVLMNHLSVIAQDIILLSTPFYGFLRLDDRYVTGSSIMPQKRNPDFAEVIRSKAAFAQGSLVSLLGIQKGAMSGYNRDTQQSKTLIMDLLREVRDAPVVLGGAIATLHFDTERMKACCEQGFINSTDVADWLAREHGLSFRDCYDLLSLAVKYSEEQGRLTPVTLEKAASDQGISISLTPEDAAFIEDPEIALMQKRHTGAPSVESVRQMLTRQSGLLTDFRDRVEGIQSQLQSAKDRCFGRQL